MFAHGEKSLQLLPWPQTLPHVSVLYIICGLVHFMGVGGLEIFQGRLVAR